MEDIRVEPESLFHAVASGNRLHPPIGMSNRMLPSTRANFRVDFRERDEDVIVVTDLPGVNKEPAAPQLVNPRVLEIT